MVDEVHDPAAAFARLDAFATLLATERSLLTQESSKAMVDECVRTGEIARVTEARWAGELAASGDPAEGVAAFFERRSPRFTWAGPSQ
jgi:enoyl-CoA hydratase/carnithine racemase